jgi:hypothetical protein
VSVALFAVAQLGGDEDILARNARGGNGSPDASLVSVGSGGVYVAVPGLERVFNDALCFFRRHLEHSEAELRDLNAVVEGQLRDGGFMRLGHRRFFRW